MAIVNIQYKTITPEPQYKPLNCQAVAQLILDFRRSVADHPNTKESRLDYFELMYRLDKAGSNVYTEKYGSEWLPEIREANRRILEEFGRV